jgi:hypothetical protein
MKICLVGYVDNTPENKQMLETYEFKNDFWAENFKFRRRDGKQVTDDELKQVSKWLDREVIKKHRTNWLSDRNPAYIDVTDPVVIKKHYPWMTDEQIKEQLESERRAKELEAIRNLPYEERMQRMLAMPCRPNSIPTSNPAPADLPRQLELEFVE